MFGETDCSTPNSDLFIPLVPIIQFSALIKGPDKGGKLITGTETGEDTSTDKIKI
jgi:hypothetical protein